MQNYSSLSLAACFFFCVLGVVGSAHADPLNKDLSTKPEIADQPVGDASPSADFQNQVLSNPYTNSYAQMQAINEANATPVPEEKAPVKTKAVSRTDAKKKINAILQKDAAVQVENANKPPEHTHKAEESLLR